MPKDEGLWAAVKQTLWTADEYTPEIVDIAVHTHLAEGAFVGLATFAAMKRGNVAARYLKSSRDSVLFRAAKFGVNAAAGMSTARLTCYCLSTEDDKRELTNRIVHAPLMPTQSPSADLFCDNVLEAYHRKESELTELYPKLDAQSMERFAQNCQLRSVYEKILRKKQDLDAQEPVSIPFMGVPTDFPLNQSALATKAKYFSVCVEDGFECIPPYNDEEVRLFIKDCNEFVKELLIVGTVTFLLMRKVPQHLLVRIRPYLADAGLAKRNYLLDAPPKAGRHFFVKATKLGFDLCASLFVSFFVGGIYIYSKARIFHYQIETPLVAGRSTMSEHLCEDLVREYGDMQSSLAKSEHVSLRDLSAMVHNCQRRQELLRAKGLGKDSPVPPPGVPNGITRDEMDKVWAESLVTDREMEESNDNVNE